MAKKNTESKVEKLNAALAAAVKEEAAAKKEAARKEKADAAAVKKAVDVIVSAFKSEEDARARYEKTAGGAQFKAARAYAAARAAGVSADVLNKAVNAALNTAEDGAARVFFFRVRKTASLLDVLPESGASTRMIDAAAVARKAGMADDDIKRHVADGNISALTACKTGDAKTTTPSPAPKLEKPVESATADDVSASALYDVIKRAFDAAELPVDAPARRALEVLAAMAGKPAATA